MNSPIKVNPGLQFFLASLLLFCILCFPFVALADGEGTPEAVVRDFYDWYMPRQDTDVSLLKLKQESFETELFNELTRVMNAPPHEEGLKDTDLAFDPFIHSQIPAEGYSLGAKTMKGATATVEVILNFGGSSQTVRVLLRKQTGSWKIADLLYQKDSSLLKYLKEIDRP